MAEETKLYHDIESKTASLKSAAKLLRECPADQKRELITLMRQAAQDIQKHLSELEKGLS